MLLKFTLAICSILFVACGSTQKKDKEFNPSQSTYLVLGLKSDHPSVYFPSSGFFVRKNNRTYLVSTYHSLFSQNTMTKTPVIPQIDTFMIMYKNLSGTDGILFLNLKEYRLRSKPMYFFEGADFGIIDLTNLIPADFPVNYIEVGSRKINFFENPDRIIAFAHNDADKDVKTFTDTVKFEYLPITDTIGYPYLRIPVPFSHSYFISNQSKPGMSGAPVFFYYEKLNEYKFAGIVSSHFQQQNSTLIVRPEIIFSQIDSLSRTAGQ